MLYRNILKTTLAGDFFIMSIIKLDKSTTEKKKIFIRFNSVMDRQTKDEDEEEEKISYNVYAHIKMHKYFKLMNEMIFRYFMYKRMVCSKRVFEFTIKS